MVSNKNLCVFTTAQLTILVLKADNHYENSSLQSKQIMWFTCSLSLVLNLKRGIKIRKISNNVLLRTYIFTTVIIECF